MFFDEITKQIPLFVPNFFANSLNSMFAQHNVEIIFPLLAQMLEILNRFWWIIKKCGQIADHFPNTKLINFKSVFIGSVYFEVLLRGSVAG